MTKPKLLDLFCGLGGATRGYQLGGFEVWGVDNEPQPHYVGDHFLQADVLALDGWFLSAFDAFHASPPCKLHTILNVGRPDWRDNHLDLLTPTRELLERYAAGRPWVIENVPRAPMRTDVMLCGSMFGLGSGERYLQRHRLFETSLGPLPQPKCRHNGRLAIGVYGHGRWDNTGGKHRGGYQGNAAENAEAMGIEWGNRDGVAQAIPPDYARWLAPYLLAAI